MEILAIILFVFFLGWHDDPDSFAHTIIHGDDCVMESHGHEVKSDDE